MLHQTIEPDGKLTPVVTKIDGDKFSEFRLETIAGA
jgi:hypothetical protein